MNDFDEDILELEDNVGLMTIEPDVIMAKREITPDTLVYRLRLSYSKETFLAAYGEQIEARRMVIVPTRYGKDLAQVIGQVNKIPLHFEFSIIERVATTVDIERYWTNKGLEKDAFNIAKEKILAHNLDMKLVSVHYLLEYPKILFFFTAENRIDFRELVKDLVSVFKARIELRQIGIRDEARFLGGIGICGRRFCCHAISDKLKPVSIRMAKEQGMSLNSNKISGQCERLLCCLAYEYGLYNEQHRNCSQECAKSLCTGESWCVRKINAAAGDIKNASKDAVSIEVPFSYLEETTNRK
jgi:cell fate regulator YaaT (PSP1 superfamily)